jgi:hypothetical protein
MIYGQFYQKSASDPTKLVEACGDRAVIILDGRGSLELNIAFIRQECEARGYAGFSLYRGDTFTRSFPITSIQRI